MNSASDLLNVKINKFSFLWLLLLGSIFVVFDAYSMGIDLIKQAENSLAKFQAQSFAFHATALSLTRELISVKVGIILAYLSPIIGIFEYFRIKKETATDIEKRKVLISSRFKSLIIVTPILVVLGLIVSILAAYFESTAQTLSGYLEFGDFAVAIIKSLIFGAALAITGILQIKFFFKWSKVTPIIIVCLLIVHLNFITVLVLDYFLSSLMFELL